MTQLKTNTVETLKIYIDAIELIGGTEWVPNREQWETIKQKIRDLPTVEAQASPALPHPMPIPGYMDPAPHAAPPIAPRPVMSSSLYDNAQHPSAPHNLPQYVPPPSDPSLASDPNQTVKLKVNPDGSPTDTFL